MIHHHLMYSNWVSESMYYRLPDSIGSVGDTVCAATLFVSGCRSNWLQTCRRIRDSDDVISINVTVYVGVAPAEYARCS